MSSRQNIGGLISEVIELETTAFKPDLELKALGSFIGTEQYHRVLGFLVTDGVKYIMENGYGWFVTDSLAVIMCSWNLRNADFLTVELHTNLEEHTAEMRITDGNDHILYRQEYKYTDSKRELLKLYYERRVLLLASEH